MSAEGNVGVILPWSLFHIWVPSDFMIMHSVLLVIFIRLCSLDESEKGEKFISHLELTIGISKHTFSVLLTPKKHT